MKKLTIEITGEDIGDLLSGLHLIKWRVMEGQVSRNCQDALRQYSFTITNEPDVVETFYDGC